MIDGMPEDQPRPDSLAAWLAEHKDDPDVKAGAERIARLLAGATSETPMDEPSGDSEAEN